MASSIPAPLQNQTRRLGRVIDGKIKMHEAPLRLRLGWRFATGPIEAFDKLGIVQLQLIVLDDPGTTLGIEHNVVAVTRTCDVTYDYGGAWGHASKEDAFVYSPKAHSLGRILVEHVMVENRDHPEGAALYLGKNQIVCPIYVASFLHFRPEMEMVIAHHIQEKIFIRPSIHWCCARRTHGRCIALPVWLNREMRGQVIAAPNLVEKGPNAGGMG